MDRGGGVPAKPGGAVDEVRGEGNHQETSVGDLVRAIREAGGTAVERDTLYRRVVREGASWRVG